MKVKDLIAKLQECNQEHIVCISKDVQLSEYTWTTTELEINHVQKDYDFVILES